MAKSYWQSVYIESATAKKAVMSWFGVLSEGLTVYQAEILCDIETDREKKIRAFTNDDDGKHFMLQRTLGRSFTISKKPIPRRPHPGPAHR